MYQQTHSFSLSLSHTHTLKFNLPESALVKEEVVETEGEEPGLMTMVLFWMIIAATVRMTSHNPTLTGGPISMIGYKY